MEKKYELTTNTKIVEGRKVFQIKALINFGDVKAGDLGGYIEKEENLSHSGNAWVYDNAAVYDNAKICENARIYENVMVYDEAIVYGETIVHDNAKICGKAWIYRYTRIYNNSKIQDRAVLRDAYIANFARVYGNAKICDGSTIYNNSIVCGDTEVHNGAEIGNDARICSNADYILFKGFGSRNRNTTMFKNKNGDIMVKCGCFDGTLKDFSEKIKETHGDSKYAKEYLACVEAAKIHFEIDE